MLASAEIEGLKSYHFKETHELQDQLLAQRSVVSKLTLRLQEALQVTTLPQCAYSEIVPWAPLICHNLLQGGHQAAMLHDEMTTMRQSHGISMKRLQVLARTAFAVSTAYVCTKAKHKFSQPEEQHLISWPEHLLRSLSILAYVSLE